MWWVYELRCEVTVFLWLQVCKMTSWLSNVLGRGYKEQVSFSFSFFIIMQRFVYHDAIAGLYLLLQSYISHDLMLIYTHLKDY